MEYEFRHTRHIESMEIVYIDNVSANSNNYSKRVKIENSLSLLYRLSFISKDLMKFIINQLLPRVLLPCDLNHSTFNFFTIRDNYNTCSNTDSNTNFISKIEHLHCYYNSYMKTKPNSVGRHIFDDNSNLCFLGNIRSFEINTGITPAFMSEKVFAAMPLLRKLKVTSEFLVQPYLDTYQQYNKQLQKIKISTLASSLSHYNEFSKLLLKSESIESIGLLRSNYSIALLNKIVAAKPTIKLSYPFKEGMEEYNIANHIKILNLNKPKEEELQPFFNSLVGGVNQITRAIIPTHCIKYLNEFYQLKIVRLILLNFEEYKQSMYEIAKKPSVRYIVVYDMKKIEEKQLIINDKDFNFRYSRYINHDMISMYIFKRKVF
ncbi:hypothetical protein PPL_06626 [Heterostelium album PN500]|uniref:Uncharacterized protein n=1 Tax=Heterostelium pallidum (strain ATCC 26659 / Pp 5 / PN500) TaxID=670386 RepID=D3BF93_HETP5|nr:hypothetical protein PPL_06626 [Heterostelium album PN500]EFA79807.1 hypothetical protein PPL_06626 [Heterostelium album PN500]|eukprot:XP_020431928.1 hypothetical protein PPL_06626 [Heterostelium album PN500]